MGTHRRGDGQVAVDRRAARVAQDVGSERTRAMSAPMGLAPAGGGAANEK